MEAKIKQMETLLSLCQYEVDLLQQNFVQFLKDGENIRRFLTDFEHAFGKVELNKDSLVPAVVFDRYMTQLGAVINMARKFNIQLTLQRNLGKEKFRSLDSKVNLGQSYYECSEFLRYFEDKVPKEYVKLAVEKRSDSGQRALLNSERTTTTKEVVQRVKFCDEFSQDLKDVYMLNGANLNFKNLFKYVEGFEFSAIVSYVDNCKPLTFYINEMDEFELLELNRNRQKHCLLGESSFPRCGEVFGVSINDKIIMRAIKLLGTKDSKSSRMLLVDSGMEVPMDQHCKFYRLSLKYQQLPAQAVECLFQGVANTIYDQKQLAKLLESYELQKANFKVVRQVDRVLHLLLIESRCESDAPFTTSLLERPIIPNTKNPFICGLVDEEKSDTNDQSVMVQKKDIILNNQVSNTLAEGVVVQITVTHVANMISFYGQIETHGHISRGPLFWKDDSISLQQKLMYSPKFDETVLAQYPADGLWYRAKLVEFDEDKKMCTVFYVDYGNVEKVSLNCLARYTPEDYATNGAFRAMSCRLFGICDATNGDKYKQKLGKQLLLINLLNQKLNVKIKSIENNQKLVVQIVDKDFVDIPDILLELGYVKQYSK